MNSDGTVNYREKILRFTGETLLILHFIIALNWLFFDCSISYYFEKHSSSAFVTANFSSVITLILVCLGVLIIRGKRLLSPGDPQKDWNSAIFSLLISVLIVGIGIKSSYLKYSQVKWFSPLIILMLLSGSTGYLVCLGMYFQQKKRQLPGGVHPEKCFKPEDTGNTP